MAGALPGPVADRAGPEARYEQRESVELAFLTALQRLPPRQRAVLILRDVMGFSVAEISSQLGTSVPAVNSALQRARAAARAGAARPQPAVDLRDLGDQRTSEIVQQYADAIERGDADTLVSMLTEDATWSMPPHPTWFQGHRALRDWLIRDPLAVRWKHLATRANGQLAVGCYLSTQHRPVHGGRDRRADPGRAGSPRSPGSWDLAVRAARGQAGRAEIFARFGLPAELPLTGVRAFGHRPVA